MTDQQLAGGVMWVLGSISYSIAIFFGFYRWLEPEPERTSRPSMPAITT
jgi:cytochrome c oxidase assembly factor CtaG